MKLLSCITYECKDIVYKILRNMNSVLGLCLCLRDTALEYAGYVSTLHLLTRVAFKLDASNSFIVVSCVISLGLEVEAFREMMGNSPLGCRVRVGQMCRDRESRISVILFMVDLRVVDILGVVRMS